MFAKIFHAAVPSSTALAALIDSGSGMHPINAIALLTGAFASLCIGSYYIFKIIRDKD